MPTQIAKRRFLPNVPVKAGILYKVVVNGKDYTVRAKYNQTLSTFNAMWFDNIYPKQYYFNTSQFAASDVTLMPSDEIIVNETSYVNDQIGALTKDELEVIFTTYKEARLVSGLILTGAEDHRIHKINIRPFRNPNSEELKYFSGHNWARNPTVNIFKVNKAQEIVFEVTETFTPFISSSATAHSAVVDFTGFSITYEGTAPTITTATNAVYAIPNSLTSRKLTVTPNGDAALILKFE